MNLIVGVSWFIIALTLAVTLDVMSKFSSTFMSPFEVTTCRFFVATILFIPFMLKEWKRTGFCKTQYIRIHALRGFLFCSAMIARCYVLKFISVNTVVVIGYCVPIFNLMFSIIILREKAKLNRWISTLIPFMAIFIILDPKGAPLKYIAILGVSEIVFSLLSIINRQYASRDTILNMVFYLNLFSFLFGLVPSIGDSNCHLIQVFEKYFILIIGLGIVANLYFYVLLKAFYALEPSVLAPFQYLDFAISAIYGYFMFGDKLNQRSLIGFIIIILNVIVTLFIENRSKNR